MKRAELFEALRAQYSRTSSTLLWNLIDEACLDPAGVRQIHQIAQAHGVDVEENYVILFGSILLVSEQVQP